MPRLNLGIEREQNMSIWKKLLRAKRAFSPVIAALILMLLAVAAGVVVYAYVMGWMGGATQNPSTVKGQLQYDSLANNSTDILIYVRNVGGKTLDLTNGAVYIDGAHNSTLSGTLTVGDVKDASLAYVCTANIWYIVTVVCEDGTTVSQSFQAT